MEPWSTRRTAILNKFTTSEKLSLVSSFISGGEKGIYSHILKDTVVLIQYLIYVKLNYDTSDTDFLCKNL